MLPWMLPWACPRKCPQCGTPSLEWEVKTYKLCRPGPHCIVTSLPCPRPGHSSSGALHPQRRPDRGRASGRAPLRRSFRHIGRIRAPLFGKANPCRVRTKSSTATSSPAAGSTIAIDVAAHLISGYENSSRARKSLHDLLFKAEENAQQFPRPGPNDASGRSFPRPSRKLSFCRVARSCWTLR